ncbi:MAG: transcriptional regulator [Gammaproteobacteria bacterium]|nr:transcriptional regulator [Gammaproteobacteria bacterium]|tara:strand:+ start:14 stop:508 length:495 start_codon:yes stop_codon:yes gene_type:complete
MKSAKLDKIDMRILQILQKDGRITNQNLAEQVNLSPSSCLQRVRRLEKADVIASYQAHLNLASIARHIICMATVSVKNHTQEEFSAFETLIKSIPEVVECYTVSGESDFLMKIVCPDMKRYVEINEQLVGNSRYQVTINSYVVMKENKPFRGVDLITLGDSSER